MINCNAVDFSERRSEEVIHFFWRSVYLILLENTLVLDPRPQFTQGQTRPKLVKLLF